VTGGPTTVPVSAPFKAYRCAGRRLNRSIRLLLAHYLRSLDMSKALATFAAVAFLLPASAVLADGCCVPERAVRVPIGAAGGSARRGYTAHGSGALRAGSFS